MRLLERGERVVGLDNLNDYYDVSLKQARLARFRDHPNYVHVHADLADRDAMEACFATHRPARVVHLAAQAGVRYAAQNPHVYASSNITGFLHVLEGCRQHGCEHHHEGQSGRQRRVQHGQRLDAQCAQPIRHQGAVGRGQTSQSGVPPIAAAMGQGGHEAKGAQVAVAPGFARQLSWQQVGDTNQQQRPARQWACAFLADDGGIGRIHGEA